MADPTVNTKSAVWAPGGMGPKVLGTFIVLAVIGLLGYSFFGTEKKAPVVADTSKSERTGATTPGSISIDHSNVQINQYYGDVENGSKFNVGTGDTTTTSGVVSREQQKPPVTSLPPKANQPQTPDSASIHRKETLERAGREQKDSTVAQLKRTVRQWERYGANTEGIWKNIDTIKCDVRALKQIVKDLTDSIRAYSTRRTQEVRRQAPGDTTIVGLNEERTRAGAYRPRTSVN